MWWFCSDHSIPAQLLDPGKDPLEDVAAVASQDPKPLPPEIYTEPVQFDKSQPITFILKIKFFISYGN